MNIVNGKRCADTGPRHGLKGDMFIGIALWIATVLGGKSQHLGDWHTKCLCNRATWRPLNFRCWRLTRQRRESLPTIKGEVVARNIACIAQGSTPKYRYTGKGSCIMHTGFGRAHYSTVHYFTKPKPYITLLGPSRISYLGKIAFEKYWLNFWIWHLFST